MRNFVHMICTSNNRTHTHTLKHTSSQNVCPQFKDDALFNTSWHTAHMQEAGGSDVNKSVAKPIALRSCYFVSCCSYVWKIGRTTKAIKFVVMKHHRYVYYIVRRRQDIV